ncbi:hypothetical protein, partial [Rheinheimera baltica]|uniref:hypothetical protein n=1 Tax=Rheinheimera baltica TaxID=67576 RepID=UPI00273D4A57
PYYHQRWQKAGVDDIRTVDSMAQFQQLPILTKADIQQHYDQLKAKTSITILLNLLVALRGHH